jgi:hypothetical protein
MRALAAEPHGDVYLDAARCVKPLMANRLDDMPQTDNPFTALSAWPEMIYDPNCRSNAGYDCCNQRRSRKINHFAALLSRPSKQHGEAAMWA